MFEKCYRKSCEYVRNNSTRQKGKKSQIYNIKLSLEHNSMKIYDQQRLETLEEKKAGANADMVSEGFANFISKGDGLANSRDVNPLETIWIIVDKTTYKDPVPPQKTGRAKRVSTLCLEKCFFNT